MLKVRKQVKGVPIIDAHAHIFDRVRGLIGSGITESLPFGKARCGNDEIIRLMPPLAVETSFPPQVLLEYMDLAGVDKAVLLQAPFYGNMNDYVRQAVQRWPDRFIGTAYLDPWLEDAPRTFHHIVDQLGFGEIDLTEATGLIGLYPEARLDDQDLEWFWEESKQRSLVVTLDLGPIGGRAYQTQALRNILSHHPGLKIVIAHLGQPPLRAQKDEQLNQLWQEQILLARHPGVWLDMAALPAYAGYEDYPYPSACRFLRQAVELVGSDKILWGSDIPGLLNHATYSQLIGFVARHCDFLSESDQAKILGGNALQVYGGIISHAFTKTMNEETDSG